MKTIFQHSFIFKRPIQECFNYLGHRFENAPFWMEGCLSVVVRPQHKRFGLHIGKTFDRTVRMPLGLTTIKKPDVILEINESKPFEFEDSKRFVVRMDFPFVDPHFCYQLKSIDHNTTTFNYQVYTHKKGLLTNLVAVPLLKLVIDGRLRRSHRYLKKILDSGEAVGNVSCDEISNYIANLNSTFGGKHYEYSK